MVTAFLNPKVDRDNIFMTTPQGIEWLGTDLTSEDSLRLRKALYGLKQAPLLWYNDNDAYLKKHGFKQMTMDQNLYAKDDGLLLLLYVHNLVIHNSPEHEKDAEDIREALKVEYKMMDLGQARTFCGINIEQTQNHIRIHQQGYSDQILARFNMMNAIDASTPLYYNVDLYRTDVNDKGVDVKEYPRTVGSLVYASLGTRPDISFTVMTLSWFNRNPNKMHLIAAKRVLRYLKCTRNPKLTFEALGKSINLYGFMDSD
jgi:hypothetical protein